MDFFTESENKQVWTCNVLIGDKEQERPCGATFSHGDKNLNKGNRIGNLKRHLNRWHMDAYKETEEKEKRQGRAMIPGIPITRQTSVTQFFESEEITIPMTAAKMIKGIVISVARDGIPLRYFKELGGTTLMGDMAKRVGVSLDRSRIRSYVINAAEKMKLKIKEELKDKFIHLKFDCATRIRTNYLGVTARYVNSNNEAITTTLSITDTKSQHTSSELKVLLHIILEEYDIPLNHVLCCVTDNASNMIRVVKDLNEDLAAMVPPTAASGSGTDDSDAMVLDAATASDGDEDTVYTDPDSDEEGGDEAAEQEFMEEIENAMPDTISHVRCGVHTLQLAIQDGLKQPQAAAMIGKIRNLAVELRTPKLAEKVKKAGHRMALLDQETR
jgi:hypothetical protein